MPVTDTVSRIAKPIGLAPPRDRGLVAFVSRICENVQHSNREPKENPTMRLQLIAVMAIGLVGLLPPGLIAADSVVLEPAGKCSNFFADSNTQLRYRLQHTAPLKGRARWSFSLHQRTIAHGEMAVIAEAGKTIDIAFPLKTPYVKEGVVLQAQCSVAVYADGEQEQKPIAAHDKILWIFPRDPFVDRREWLKSLDITLFDSEGRTADVLEKAGVPFTLSRNVDSLDGIEQGTLVIGEATAWRDHRSLGEVMVKAAARGLPVLCLAPGEGSIELPSAEETNMPAPTSVSFRRGDFIHEIDKRLDTDWRGDEKDATARLTIQCDRGQVVVASARKPNGWIWLDVRYSQPRGRLLICGMPIIAQWDAHPASRYLFRGLLERLAATK